MIEVVRARIDIGLHVIVRPRGGDFLYSAAEFEVMYRDIETVKQCGGDGVVIGILQADGSIDRERTAELVRRARPLRVTFHRAFDMSRDPAAALEDLIELGIERVLTSGQAPTVPEGAELIAELVRRAGDRIIVMPGGGVTVENARPLVDRTGVREIHVGDPAAEIVESPMQYRNPKIYMGTPENIAEYRTQRISAAKIRTIVDSLAAKC
jgi:copper homeostasis protein